MLFTSHPVTNGTFLHTEISTQTARGSVPVHSIWYLFTLYCVFMQIVTISVQCFMWLTTIYLCSCLCCLLLGALTLLGILKSRQPISSCSHHLKGNECHFIETVSHSLHWSNNISDVYVLSGAPSFSLPHVEDALHWPFITPHVKIHLMFKHIPDLLQV